MMLIIGLPRLWSVDAWTYHHRNAYIDTAMTALTPLHGGQDDDVPAPLKTCN